MRSVIIAAAFAVTLLLAPCAHCDDVTENDLRVVEGKIVAVDVANSLIIVQGGIEITFPIEPTTDFMYGSQSITLSDIGVDDYVVVEYYRQGLESRVPLKVIRVTVKYKKSESPDFSKPATNQYGGF